MKKTFIASLVSALFCMTAQAQESGFYRIQNTYTGRYISVEDTNPNNYSTSIQSGSVDVAGIRTKSDWNYVEAAPSTILYLNKISGSSYDFESQGSSIYKLSGNRLYVTLTVQADGSYKASGSHSGITVWLKDNADLSADESDCFIWANGKNTNADFWNLKPLNTTDNYLGIETVAETNDGYWGSIFAGFPFKLVSEGMKAYYVDAAANGAFSLKEITGTIPAATPVIIKCSSNDPKNNQIQPVNENVTSVEGNKLTATYCSLYAMGHINVKTYNQSTMRTLGVSDGKLAFVKADSKDLVQGTYMRGNRAYLTVAAGSPSVFTEGETAIESIKSDDAQSAQGTYTLTGIRIPDGVTPAPGIYIQNGKKIIIK